MFSTLFSSRCIVCHILILLVSIQLSAGQFQKNTGKKRFGNWFLHDPISFFRDMDNTVLLGSGLTGVMAYSLTFVDKGNSIDFQNALGNSAFFNKINDVGHPYYAGAFMATVFGTSLLTNNNKFQDAAFTSLQSIIYNHFTVGALKFTFARARPREREGVRDFDILESSHSSFPSGHTSTVFAMVTPWVMYYNRPVSYALYAIPVSVGIGRIARGAHWLSDVSTAAVIGTYWGYYLSKKHLNKAKNKNLDLQIAPVPLKSGGGINVRFEF